MLIALKFDNKVTLGAVQFNLSDFMVDSFVSSLQLNYFFNLSIMKYKFEYILYYIDYKRVYNNV